MNLRSIVHATLLLAASGAALAQTTATSVTSEDEFTVGDIRVEGLQRISEGTVYNYLPLNIGDRLTRQRRLSGVGQRRGARAVSAGPGAAGWIVVEVEFVPDESLVVAVSSVDPPGDGEDADLGGAGGA